MLSEVDETHIPAKQKDANIEKAFKQFLQEYDQVDKRKISLLSPSKHQFYINKNKWRESVAERPDSPFFKKYDYMSAR